jgi:hypothetical protein
MTAVGNTKRPPSMINGFLEVFMSDCSIVEYMFRN